MRGYEIAFQRYFDNLPAPWDGLGMQANYTYVQKHGHQEPEHDDRFERRQRGNPRRRYYAVGVHSN